MGLTAGGETRGFSTGLTAGTTAATGLETGLAAGGLTICSPCTGIAGAFCIRNTLTKTDWLIDTCGILNARNQRKGERQMAITKSMAIAEILHQHPECAQVMLNHGLHCVMCHAAAGETLEQGALAHGFSPEQVEELVKELNKAAAGQEKKPAGKKRTD